MLVFAQFLKFIQINIFSSKCWTHFLYPYEKCSQFFISKTITFLTLVMCFPLFGSYLFFVMLSIFAAVSFLGTCSGRQQLSDFISAFTNAHYMSWFHCWQCSKLFKIQLPHLNCALFTLGIWELAFPQGRFFFPFAV